MLLRPSIYVYDMFLRTVLRFIHLANRLEIVAKNAYLVIYIYMNLKIGLAEILFYYTNNKKNNTKLIYIFSLVQNG